MIHHCVWLILLLESSCETVDSEAGTVTFKNGVTVKADIIIGADGIRVR